MGFKRKFLSVLLGSSEETLIKAQAEIGHAISSKTSDEYNANATFIKGNMDVEFEKQLGTIISTLGNQLNHHAQISNSNYQNLKQHPLMLKYIEFYAKEVFAKSYYIGLRKQMGEDQKHIDDTTLLIQELMDNMKVEYQRKFEPKVVECFLMGLNKAIECGMISSASS